MYTVMIASDTSSLRTYHMEGKAPVPVKLAYELGRAESGEIVQIWDDDNTGRVPDHIVYWDRQHREYRPRRGI